MSSKYSIKDLERISGIKAHTLRIWEQRYDILNPERTSTNIRYYSSADLKRILNISLLNNNGYKISNIAKLSDDVLLQEVEKFLNNYKKESDQVDSLVLCLMDMNEERFEKTINNSVVHFGFENTMEKIIFPFLRHLGNMWQVGMVTAAQEHYISNLIRQKLIVGIDKIIAPPNATSRIYMFFLPDSELHELGLLYTHYLTKIRGHKCVYLGQSVPLEDLVSISKTVQPHYLVTILTAQMQDVEVRTFLTACNRQIPEADFLLSGRLILSPEEKLLLPSERFRIFEDFQAFKKMV